jgi:hypothetical protein
MKAKITSHGVITEDGRLFDLLGSGARYGFESPYAVRETGEIQASPRPAQTLPWPWNDNEIEL